MNIILYLIDIINYLYQMNCWLIMFICKYIPLKQWTHDDSKSPKYQKFAVDRLPVIKPPEKKLDWKKIVADYPSTHYGKQLKPVSHRKESNIPKDCRCPSCSAPSEYLYRNSGSRKQLLCKVCSTTFVPEGDYRSSSLHLQCPHCGHSLVRIKDRKHFCIHKCINLKCPFYLKNLKKLDKEELEEKYKYKLHYIYREFQIDFFSMDLDSLPKNASSLKFRKHDSHVMSLCLTMHVNLGLSLRKTSQAMKDLYGIRISHQQVANYCKTAAVVIKPFVDHYDYAPGPHLTADETYIKVRGVKGYIWFIVDAAKRSILGYQVSDNRGVGPCILAMRMALKHFKETLPKDFKFIADGYSAYPLAAQQFFHEFGEKLKFEITQVIGLTNDDEVSKEYRPYKEIIERLNRTFKESYRVKCGYDNFNGASYSLSLWVAYYNFLRPHKHFGYKVLNHLNLLDKADNIPGKWQLLIHLGQQTILKMQEEQENCS